MKQKIMEKLFAEKPLTNEEILLIGSSLSDENKKSELPGYKHDVKDSLTKACGLVDADFKDVNNVIRTEIIDNGKNLDCDSKQVEIYERIAKMNPQSLRVLMYQFVKMKNQLKKGLMSPPVGMNIGGIGGMRGDGGGLDDFLNFLDGLRK